MHRCRGGKGSCIDDANKGSEGDAHARKDRSEVHSGEKTLREKARLLGNMIYIWS